MFQLFNSFLAARGTRSRMEIRHLHFKRSCAIVNVLANRLIAQRFVWQLFFLISKITCSRCFPNGREVIRTTSIDMLAFFVSSKNGSENNLFMYLSVISAVGNLFGGLKVGLMNYFRESTINFHNAHSTWMPREFLKFPDTWFWIYGILINEDRKRFLQATISAFIMRFFPPI